MAKTLFCYFTPPEIHAPRFFEKEGDFTHLDGAIVNCDVTAEQVDEIMDILEDKNLTWMKAPTKDWDHFVIIGGYF